MTTLISNASAEALASETAAQPETTHKIEAVTKTVPQTLASRYIILTLCLAMVLSTLAYGTVHTWSLAIFQAGAALIVALWAVDAWRSGVLRFSRNVLQVPLIGLIGIGLVQLLPLGTSADAGALSLKTVQTLSLEPYATRLVLIQIIALLVYFAAALSFTDSPRRLRLLTYTVIIFGFLLAIFGLIQYFSSPMKIYWVTERPQSVPFGPFINRHHFAGYMELALAIPLGLVFSGAVDRDKGLIYAFAALVMGIALVMTNSRGGILSLIAEIFFLVIVSSMRRKRQSETENASEERARVRSTLMRAGLGFALVAALFVGVVMYGGEDALSRFVGTVNAQDPTTGRTHFWSVTLDVIREHPLLGVGLGAFKVAYTQHDTRNGLFRLEQAHNDYLQVLSDAGVVGAALGLFFIIALFRMGLARRQTKDKFRRGVATGALAGCFAVLIHSFFDFTLHTTSNALLFLVLVALATVNGRVEQASPVRRRRKKRRRSAQIAGTPVQSQEKAGVVVAAAAGQE